MVMKYQKKNYHHLSPVAISFGYYQHLLSTAD